MKGTPRTILPFVFPPSWFWRESIPIPHLRCSPGTLSNSRTTPPEAPALSLEASEAASSEAQRLRQACQARSLSSFSFCLVFFWVVFLRKRILQVVKFVVFSVFVFFAQKDVLRLEVDYI